MSIITQLLNKTLFVTFFLSFFVVIRHLFLFIRHMRKPEVEKYVIARKEMVYLALALAFIITTIFKGIGI